MNKSNIFKRIFAAALAVVLAASVCPLNSFAITLGDVIVENNAEIDFTYKEVDGGIKITGYKGCYNSDYYLTARTVVVPDTINDLPVTEIGDGAFFHLPYMYEETYDEETDTYIKGDTPHTTKIVLPATVKKIGFGAFCSSSVGEVNLNELNELTYISAYAFLDSFLEGDIVLPESVTYVGASAFTFTNISSLHIGKNVSTPVIEKSKDFGKVGFSGIINIYTGVTISTKDYERSIANACINLKKITVDPENPYYRSVNGVLYSKDMTKLYSYPSGKSEALFIMPESVDAFYNAFGGMFIQPIKTSSLGPTTDIMDGNLSLGYGGVRVPIDGQKNGLHQSYKITTPLKTVILSENVTKITSIAFYNTSLERIFIPKNVTEIGDKAFWHCNELETVAFDRDSSYSTLPEECFYDCSSLKNVSFGLTNSLGKKTFGNCTSLESIDLTNVKALSSTSFDGCTSLTDIVYQNNGGERKVTVSAQAFDNQEALETVMLGNCVSSVKEEAFANCEKLTTAYISDEITEIAETAFSGCPNLTIVCPSEECYAYSYAEANNIPVTTLQVMPIPNQTYTGFEITPELTVKSSGNILEQGRDYTPYFSDNLNVGMASVDVLGEGSYSMFACACKFAIIQRSLDDGIVIGEISPQNQTGKAIAPEVSVTYGETELQKGKDYIVEYADNVDPGTAKAVVMGINNFTGIYVIEFEIIEAQIPPEEIIYGDATGDGKITLEDYALVYSYISGKIVLDELVLNSLDVNRDGVCDGFDLYYLNCYINMGKALPCKA